MFRLHSAIVRAVSKAGHGFQVAQMAENGLSLSAGPLFRVIFVQQDFLSVQKTASR